MRPESTAWERAAEVREAADGWLRSGAIDGATHEAVRAAYPDPRVTSSATWRILTAGMVTAVMLCILGAAWVATQPGAAGLALLLFVFAAVSFFSTEHLDASPRLARRGAAGATAFWGCVFVLAGLGLFLHGRPGIRSDLAFDAVLLAGALVWGAGCWRWGNALFAGFSALSLFVFLGRLPLGRVLLVLAGSALAVRAARRSDDAAWAPSHRRAAVILLVTGVVAAYVAINVYSVDEQWLEGLRHFAPSRATPPGALFVLAGVATVAFPVVILVWAWTSRRTVLLDVGIVLLALSLVTLRHYVHVASLWVVLTASGAVLIALALAVERALGRSPAGEVAGFTADALFSDERRQRILQTLPVVAAFTPAAPAPAADDKGFAGGGGTFGGGGASEKF
jgi:hypothetical protein